MHDLLLQASPELRLLLACGRSVLDPGARQEAERLLQEEEVDWAYFQRLVYHHALHPLAYRLLSSLSSEACPPDVLTDLRARQGNIARYNLHVAFELLRLLALLRGQGIEAVSFKGPLLALSAYGDLSLREMTDLDIYVPPQDHQAAKDVLARHARRKVSFGSSGAAQMMSQINNCITFELDVGSSAVPVELHTGLIPAWHDWMRFELGNAWERRTSAEVLGQRWPGFDVEDTVLLLCIHGSKHRWDMLKLLIDLAAFVKRHEIDWDEVERRAASAGCLRTLQSSLCLIRYLLDFHVPAITVSRDLARETADCARAWVDDFATLRGCSSIERARFHGWLVDRREMRWHVFWQEVTIPSRFVLSRWPLPRSLSILYRLSGYLRFVLLLWKHWKRRLTDRTAAGSLAP